MAALRQDGLRPEYESNTTALSIVYRSIGELKLDPRNPRRHSKKQIQQIATSVQAFGFTVPLIIDENLRVISGHGRLLAARLVGIEQVPTICVGHLSEAQMRAFQIADNRLTENSTWDKKLLSKQLQSLKSLNCDKRMRMHACCSPIEGGYVYLPENAEWLSTYLSELRAFPYGRHDDLVDSTSQAIHWVNRGKFMTPHSVSSSKVYL